jgi:hypothetical protein
VQPLAIVTQMSKPVELFVCKFQKHSISYLEEEYSEWMKNINNMVRLGSAYTKLSYYNPKNEYSTLTKTYYIYFQPCLLLLLSVWLIALIRALWTDDYIKKFGFMTLYSFVDLLTLIVMTTLSKLMERIDLVNRDPSAITITIKNTVTLRALNIILYFIGLYKIINLVEICRKPGFFYPEIQFTLINHVTVDSILFSVFESILPFIFMSILSVASIIVIRKHIKYRKQFQAGSSSTITIKNTVTLRALNIILYFIGLYKIINLWKACATFSH